MNRYLTEMFGVSLALTIIIELAVMGICGNWIARDRRRALLVVLVNILTNPPAVLLGWLGRLWLPPPLRLPLEIVVEMGVVAVEAYVYRSFAEKEEWRVAHPVKLAAAANLCSWGLGRLLSGIL